MGSSTLRTVIDSVQYVLQLVAYALTHLLPRDDDLWVFAGHKAGGRTDDNTGYLFSYVNDIHTTVRPVWIEEDEATVKAFREAGYEAYQADSLQAKCFLFRGGCLFLSHVNHLWPYLGGCTVVQMWHGNVLKTVGFENDRGETLPVQQRLFKEHIGYNWDRMALTSAGAPFEAFAAAFGLTEDRAMVTGYPRTDCLFDTVEVDVGRDEEAIERVASLASEGTIVSYVPTYRQGFSMSDGDEIDETRLEPAKLNALMEEYDAYFLIKHHPHSDLGLDIDDYERIVVLPQSLDVYPLLRHTDILVTDYSSVFYDFLLLDRPILFYPFDEEAYERTRGFFFAYDDVTPGPKARTPEELRESLARFLDGSDDFEEERERVRNEFYAYVDGDSSKRIYEHVLRL